MKTTKKQVSVLFLVISTLYCVCLIAANLFATKQMSAFGIPFTGALFVFPISYIFGDVVTEVWGFKRMQRLIWFAFAMDFLVVLLGLLVDTVHGVDWWEASPTATGFHAIFGLAPRIVVASFLAFIIGSMANAMVMSKMKVRTEGKHFVFRAVVSSFAGEFLDSIIFFPIALGGIVPWEQMPMFVICQVLLKTIYEIVILPITIRVIRLVKKHEGVDVYDRGVSYNIFR